FRVCVSALPHLCFCFQAGDGIRYRNVTGVQTCALPISSSDILKLYKEHGGEILTLGSDSHVAETVGYDFKASLELFESIGFKYITTFDNMKPTFHKIADIK